MMSKVGSRFTLLEVLLALVLIGMLSASAFTALHIAFKSRDSAEEKLGRTRMAEHALMMIDRDLFNCPIPGGEMKPDFTGEDESDGEHEQDTLTFYTCPWRMNPAKPYGGIIKVYYVLAEPESYRDERNESAYPVLLRRTVANVLASTEPTPRDEIICRSVAGISFEYYDGSDWSDSFDNEDEENTLPVAVKYTITLIDEKTKEEYDFSRITVLPCGTREEAESANVIR